MSSDYFDLLGLPKGFNVDLGLLEKNYTDFQQRYHPDRATGKDERLKFLSISSNLNVAYKTLLNELSRAEYILSLDGVSLTNYEPDFVLLEEIFDENQILESLEKPEVIRDFLAKKVQAKLEILEQLKHAFSIKDTKACLSSLSRLKYIEKLMDYARKKLA